MTQTGTMPTAARDVYDVAHLSGGLTRVVDTAVVALLERGRLTVDGTGRLQSVGTAVHPVEAAVLALAGPRPRRTIAGMRIRAQEDPRLTAVADRLVASGLLRRNPFAGLSSSWPAHLRTAAGRRVLQEWPAATAGSAADVALGGPERMADRVLRDTVFGASPLPPTGRGRRRDVAHGASGSWWLYGSGAGWGGDCGSGGGFGGDGGGGGGGDGGGC